MDFCIYSLSTCIMKTRFFVSLISFLAAPGFLHNIYSGCGDEPVILTVGSVNNSIHYSKSFDVESPVTYEFYDTLNVGEQEVIHVSAMTCGDPFQAMWFYNGKRLEGYNYSEFNLKKAGKYEVFFRDISYMGGNWHFTFVLNKSLDQDTIPENPVYTSIYINQNFVSKKRSDFDFANTIFRYTDTINLGSFDTTKVYLGANQCNWFYNDSLLPALNGGELITTISGTYKATFGWGYNKYEQTFYIIGNSNGPAECNYYASYAINNIWLDSNIAFIQNNVSDTIEITDGDTATLRIFRMGSACGSKDGESLESCTWIGYPDGNYVSYYAQGIQVGELKVTKQGIYSGYAYGKYHYFYIKKDPNPLLMRQNSSADHSIILSPNPANDKLLLKLNITSIYTVTIYDYFGKVLFSENMIGDEMQINTANFTKGVYLLEVFDNSKKLTKKLIIE
jgi:hypothetical protein